MKNILKTWKSYITENNDVLERYRNSLEFNEEGEIQLYHVSKNADLSDLDPSVAAGQRQGFSKQEFRTWDRSRVFFFTRLGQEDPGVGKMRGVGYVASVDPGKLYPVHEDPLFLAAPDKVADFRKIKGIDYPGHPGELNIYERVATLADSMGYKGFIYTHAGDPNNAIAVLWEKVSVKKLDKPFYNS
jgi:hypothetical protein